MLIIHSTLHCLAMVFNLKTVDINVFFLGIQIKIIFNTFGKSIVRRACSTHYAFRHLYQINDFLNIGSNRIDFV